MRNRSTLAEWRGLSRSLAIYHGMPWRRRSLRRLYADLITPGALVFDIGAHMGNHTLALLAVGARCVALEPQPIFARFLSWLFRNHPDISLLRVAVGRSIGVAKLAVSSRHPTVSTLSTGWIDQVGTTRGFENVRWDQHIEVPVTTLDALIGEHGLPDFCKIDVEGMESEILAGLSQAIPLVAIEYLPAALDVAEACVSALQRLGNYEFNVSSGETHRLALPTWVDATAAMTAMRDASRQGASGDLYARLVSCPQTAKIKVATSGRA